MDKKPSEHSITMNQIPTFEFLTSQIESGILYNL